jgi:hypothetical protein
MTEKTYQLDNQNPCLRADFVAAKLGRRTGRRFRYALRGQVSASVAAAEGLADDLSKALRIDRGIALRILDTLGDILTDRCCDGKMSGFPGFGTIYIRTRSKYRSKGKILKREAVLEVQRQVERQVMAQAPITEKFSDQYQRCKEEYLRRKAARKQAIISGGRRRRHRNDQRKREAIDQED